MAKNKFQRFQSEYTSDIDSKINSADNYLTDDELAGSDALLERGIAYQAAATSDILNALLRQVTAITVAVGDLIAANSTQNVNSLATQEQLLDGLTDAVKAIADARIVADKLDRTTATALSKSGTKLVNEKTVAHAIKNDLTTTAEGFLLDARQGKALNAAITAEATARGTAISNAVDTVNGNILALKNELNVKALTPNMTTAYTKPAGEADDLLLIWRGGSSQWDTFSRANSGILSRVLTIITD